MLGLSGVLFHFYSILNRNSCKQTMKTLIRRRVLLASDLGLHCFPMSQKWDARLICVKAAGLCVGWSYFCLFRFGISDSLLYLSQCNE